MYDAYSSMRFVYSVYNLNEQLIEPVMSDIAYTTTDPTDGDMMAVIFGVSNIVRGLKSHPITNLVVEMQVPRSPTDKTNFISYGWTLINIFNFDREVATGTWRLPLYQAPVQTSLDIRDISTLKLVPQTQLCIRLANAKPGFDVGVKEHEIKDASKP